MNGAEIALVVLAVVALVAGLLLWHARRLDRLHRRILSSRAVLETQLNQRAEVATQLALSGLLDEASAIVVTEAAWQAGIAADRLVGDRDWDGTSPLDLHPSTADTAATADLTGASDATDLTGPTGPTGAADVAGTLDRGLAESDLSVALRGALGDGADRELLAAGGGRELLDQLERTCYRAQLARLFHNETVVATQRLRGTWFVRFFHLAGRAPMPHAIDMDDVVFEPGARP